MSLGVLSLAIVAGACGARSPAPAAPATAETARTADTAPETASESETADRALPGAAEPVPARPEPIPAVECNRHDPLGPAQVSEDDHATAHGAGVRDLSRLSTSKERPVEVCGVQAQLEYLAQARCADGSQPFATPAEAHRARSGSLGAGGRCGGVIDLYEVPCPERTYTVYMDMYFCRAGESF